MSERLDHLLWYALLQHALPRYGYEALGKVTDASFVLDDADATAKMEPALTTGSEGLWLHGYWK